MRRLLSFVLIVLCVVAPTGAPSGATKYIPFWEPPPTIDRTGATDVTGALQDWLSKVPDGGLVIFPNRATYRLDGTVTLTNRVGLEINGNDTTLRANGEGRRTRSQLRFVGGHDIHVHKLNVLGANPAGGTEEDAYKVDREAQHGIELLGTARVEIDHVTVHDVYGDAIYIGRADDGTFSSQVWVHDTTLTHTGRQGIAVTAANAVVIERNHISDTRRATFDLEPNTPRWAVSDVYIAHNTIGPGRLLFLASHGAGQVDDVVVTANKLTGRPLTIDVRPEPGARRSNFYVVGNTSDTPADRTPLVFERIDGLVVSANHQRVDAGRAAEGEVGVSAADVCDLAVVANDFGVGTAAVDDHGGACGSPPSLALPAQPAIPARDKGRVPPVKPGGPAATTPAGRTTTVPAGGGPDGTADGPTGSAAPVAPATGGSGGSLAMQIAFGAVVVAAIGVGWVLLAHLRTKRRGAPT